MKSKTIKNKRGDIPITILVIGVLAVCGLAILSFSIADRKVKTDFESFNLVRSAMVQEDKFDFYQEIGFSEEEIELILDIRPSDGIGKHIFLEREGISVKKYIEN